MEFAERFVAESASIEGQYIPPTEIAASGHMAAYRAMEALADDHVTEADIKNWQNLIGGEQHLWGDRVLYAEELGVYRKHIIGIGEVTIGWENIPEDMRRLVLDANTSHDWSVERKVEHAATLHWRYERCHPYADGNGRSGRLFALWYLLHHRLKPVLFTAADRFEEYYPCFREKAPDRMVAYFQKHQTSWLTPILDR